MGMGLGNLLPHHPRSPTSHVSLSVWCGGHRKARAWPEPLWRCTLEERGLKSPLPGTWLDRFELSKTWAAWPLDSFPPRKRRAARSYPALE